MKNKFHFLFIGLLAVTFLLPSLSFSEQPDPKIWEPLGYNSFYNKKIIKKLPGISLVWIYKTATEDVIQKRIEGTRRYDLDKSQKYKNYHHEVVLWELNCSKKIMRVREYIDFDKSGSVIDRYRYNNSEWDNIFPKSRGEVLYKKVCVIPAVPVKKEKKTRLPVPKRKRKNYR